MNRAPEMLETAERIQIRSAIVITRLQDGGDRQADEVPLILDHPAVSRRHARFRRSGNVVIVSDEGSTNGTFVNRKRLNAPAALTNGDVVGVGPFRLLYDGAGLVRLSRAGRAALFVRGVAKDVTRVRERRSERILHRVSLTVRPGRVMCIIGASGSGKSTLLNIMAGRLPPSEGAVTLGTLDLRTHFAALKYDIAYLPQQETVHKLLTVRQALRYTAMLRLPRETTEEAQEATIVEAVSAVGLQDRIDATINSLSGGQRKRACLACEILARPSLLFLDEATSGLDEVTDREIMALLKRLAREGMSIVCVTHTLANLYDYCDDLVVLARGGHLAFTGSVADALRKFGGSTLGDVLTDLNEKDVFVGVTVDATPATTPATRGAGAGPAARRTSPLEGLHQFFVLLSRNVRLLLADRRALILAAIQSVVVGTLLGVAFSSFGQGSKHIVSERAALLLLGVTSLWMGCNSASKDIAGELNIFRREHDVSLSTIAFVLSKFTVTGAFAILQVLGLLLFTSLFIEGIPGGTGAQLPALIVASICGVTLGLLISSLCNGRDQVSIIVPLAVAPQLILGSGLAPLPPALLDMTRLTISAYHVRLSLEGTAGLPGSSPTSLLPPVIQVLLLLLAATIITARRAHGQAVLVE